MAGPDLRCCVSECCMRCNPAFSTGAMRRGCRLFMQECSEGEPFPLSWPKNGTLLLCQEDLRTDDVPGEGLLSDHTRSCKLILHQMCVRSIFIPGHLPPQE